MQVERASSTASPLLRMRFIPRRHRRGVIGALMRAGTVMTAQTEAVDFFAFDNSYARLPDRFFARLQPTPVAAPRLVRLNKKLAWHLELDPGKLAAPQGVEILP